MGEHVEANRDEAGRDESGGDALRPTHVPVLPEQVGVALALGPGETFVDATAGLGGHAVEAARAVGPEGTVVLNDLDPGALASAEARLRATLAASCPRVVAIHGNFAALPTMLPVALAAEAGTTDLCADAVLADLGFSSAQMDEPSRGLSFRRDGPLDMRLNPRAPVTAAELVNELSEQDLRDLLRRYGEEPSAAAIARKVVVARGQAPISTTGQLAEIIRDAARVRRSRKPSRSAGSRGGGGGIDPATRSFQALRIAVNDELGSLDRFLAGVGRGRSWLREGARVAVIAFHSLEDRAVKRRFAGLVSAGDAAHAVKGPATAEADEIERNPRARSAKLRAIILSGSTASPR
ncbi:MAG: 16S rRNA (cytosine(1402)-N(4))-methyltransferase RsmH [Planctomycetota bacterium]